MNATELFLFLGQAHQAPEFEVAGLCDFSEPRLHCLAFCKVDSEAARERVASNPETLFIVSETFPASGNAIRVSNPRLAYALASREIAGGPLPSGISATAVIHETAHIAETASVGDFAVIDADVQVGEFTVIAPFVHLHPGVQVGRDTHVGSHTSIGASGFGFEITEDGTPIRIAHVGGVVIGDRVEIGTHVSVAQGTIKPTRIADDVKIDDAVFIAHNTEIGEAAFVIAGATICGGVKVGARAWISPESVVINQANVGEGAMVGLGAAVVRDVEPGTVVAGVPAKSRGPRW